LKDLSFAGGLPLLDASEPDNDAYEQREIENDRRHAGYGTHACPVDGVQAELAWPSGRSGQHYDSGSQGIAEKQDQKCCNDHKHEPQDCKAAMAPFVPFGHLMSPNAMQIACRNDCVC